MLEALFRRRATVASNDDLNTIRSFLGSREAQVIRDRAADEDRAERDGLVKERGTVIKERDRELPKLFKTEADDKRHLDEAEAAYKAAQEIHRASVQARDGAAWSYEVRLGMIDMKLRETAPQELVDFQDELTRLLDYVRGASLDLVLAQTVLSKWGVRIPRHEGNLAELKHVVAQLLDIQRVAQTELHLLPTDQLTTRIAKLRASIEFDRVGMRLPEQKAPKSKQIFNVNDPDSSEALIGRGYAMFKRTSETVAGE